MCLWNLWSRYKSTTVPSLTPDEINSLRENRIKFYDSNMNPIDKLIRQKRKDEDDRLKAEEKVESLFNKVKWD